MGEVPIVAIFVFRVVQEMLVQNIAPSRFLRPREDMANAQGWVGPMNRSLRRFSPLEKAFSTDLVFRNVVYAAWLRGFLDTQCS